MKCLLLLTFVVGLASAHAAAPTIQLTEPLIRSGDWKLTAQKDKVGLFDLSKDVSEVTDLAKQNPEKVTELTHLMDTWLAEMAPPISGEGKRFGLEGTKLV